VAQAHWLMLPRFLAFGWELSPSAILGFCLIGFVSSIDRSAMSRRSAKTVPVAAPAIAK
jgi:xanthine/uracil permease